MQMKMKLLDYTLIGVLAGMTPLAGVQEADARTQTPQDKAEGTAQLLECTDESCASQEGLLFRLRTRSYDKPVTQGTGKQSSSAELQPDRRVTVAIEQPGKAVALGKFSIPLPGGGAIWATEDPTLGDASLTVSAPSLVVLMARRSSSRCSSMCAATTRHSCSATSCMCTVRQTRT